MPNDKTSNGPYLTVQRAAEYAGGVSKETIRRMLRSGQLRRYGIGDRPLVSKPELDRLVSTRGSQGKTQTR